MAFIDGMKKFSDSERPFLTLRETTITFSKLAIELLGFSPYIHMFTDDERKVAAFVPCENDSSAIPFYKKPKEGKQLLVRVSGKERIKALMDAAGIDDCGKGMRFYGYYIEDEKTLVIDMTPSGDEE